MKKNKFITIVTSISAIALVFSLAIAVSAAKAQGNQNQAALQVQQQNQGENTQVQAQVQAQELEGVVENEDGDDNSGKEKGQANAVEKRSAVANFVQSLKDVADRQPGGIGEQVRVVAAEQQASAERTTKAMEQVQARSKIKTFLFGSDYKNLGALRSETVQTRNRLQQLKQTLTGMADGADKTEIQNQIQALEQEQTQIQNFIKVQESKISLFGWLAKMFQ